MLHHNSNVRNGGDTIVNYRCQYRRHMLFHLFFYFPFLFFGRSLLTSDSVNQGLLSTGSRTCIALVSVTVDVHVLVLCLLEPCSLILT
jgi:hypothetical protein